MELEALLRGAAHTLLNGNLMDSLHNQQLPEIQISEQERREVLAEVAKRFSEENIEDWDFRDPDLAENDPIADLFLTMNYTTVWAVEMTRLEYIKALLESPFAELSEDKRNVVLPRANDEFWRGFTKSSLRESLTDEGRFEKRVRKSLEREWRKYGRLRPTILPLPGDSSRRSDSDIESEGEATGADAISLQDSTSQRGFGSRRHRDADIGVSVVDAIAEMMAIDEEWSTRDERGFTWWGKDHAQRVWSEPSFDDDGVEIFRIHARTAVLRDFDPSDENLAKLNALSMVATTSGFLIDPEGGTVDLAASMYVHAETTDWIRRWFGMAVALQAADAQSKAALLAEVTGATAATSAHPTSGPRPEPDDMLGILEGVPRADERCPWQGEAMLAVVEAARTAGNTVMATGDETGLTAELPFQSETSLLTVATSEQHPQIGNGVLVRLQLSVVFSEEEGPRFAMELNRRELTQLTRSHFLGSWCWHDGFVQFVTFVPNLLHLGGADLFNFVASSYSRAKWIAESIYGDDWASNRDEKGRPLATPAVADLVRDPIEHEPSADRPSEDEEWNPLNKELFDLGGDAYGNASLDVVMQAATGQLLPVPQFAKDRALFLVERTTSEKFLRRYAESFFEAFGVAFRLVWAEEWEDLNEDHALELIDDGLRRLRDEHIRNGVAEPIDLSDVEQRAIFSVMGLVGTHPTFEQVREYLFSRAAYRRLSTLDDLHLEMGIAASGVARRDTEAFWNGQLVAWKTGQAFAILDFVGQLDEPDGEDSGATVGSYSETVLEGMRLAATYDVDLVELANSIIAQVSEAHRDSATGRVWFPAEAIRALCCMEFLVTSELSDPRLDEAFMRSAQSPSEEATSRLSEIGQQVIEERGLTPVIDALVELIKDPDAPPASELL